MKTLTDLLIEFESPYNYVRWAHNKTIEEAIDLSVKGDFFLFLAKKLDVDIKPFTLAKARCVKPVINLMNNEKSVNAVRVAEKFGLNLCGIDKLNDAKLGALEAYKKAINDSGLINNTLCYAAYAAVNVNLSYQASIHASQAFAYSVDKNIETLIKYDEQTSECCREIIGDLIIEKVNQILK